MADTTMNDAAQEPPSFIPDPNETLYGGYTRFELELEVRPCNSRMVSPYHEIEALDSHLSRILIHPQFVTLLSSPLYLNYLASLKLLQDPCFIAYLTYLQYWTRPEYIKYLSYPGPTLRSLELLQQERFRTDVLSPDVVNALAREGVEKAIEYQEKD